MSAACTFSRGGVAAHDATLKFNGLLQSHCTEHAHLHKGQSSMATCYDIDLTFVPPCKQALLLQWVQVHNGEDYLELIVCDNILCF